MMDASNGMSSIIDLIIQGITSCFDILDSFQFSGISMLDFLITLFVLGAVLPVILAIVTTRASSNDVSNYHRFRDDSHIDK